ncbi:ATP-binding protein [Streptomyces sp. SBR177]
MARRRLLGVLEESGSTEAAEAAALVLSELLTNAVRHGRVRGRQIETRFVRLPGGLRIEVHDASERRPLMALPQDGAEGGWGAAPGRGALGPVGRLRPARARGGRQAGVGRVGRRPPAESPLEPLRAPA